MPSAFLTGVTGQDGGYLAERLLAEGWQVHGLIRAGDERVDDLRRRAPGVVLHEGDLVDTARVGDLVATLMPDEIYNLGGIASVAQSWAQPLLAAQVSGLGAAGLLEAAWQLHGTGRNVRVLQASSAEIFGAPPRSPQTETTPIRPVSPYGAAKAFAHHLVGVYRGRGLHAVGCILYNHESPRRPASYVTRKITRAVAHIAAGKQDSLPLGSLDIRRDWGWAPDYVDAMVRATRHAEPDDFVVATGDAHSIRDFVAASFARVGITRWHDYVTLDPSLVRPVDPAELVGDAGKARRVLGWRPTVPFEEIVRLMVDADLRELAPTESGEQTVHGSAAGSVTESVKANPRREDRAADD
jgi:GDPmannose 4,6-dehydratase